MEFKWLFLAAASLLSIHSAWGQTKILAADGAAGDGFGWAVGVSGDTIVIGAPYDGDRGASAGSAYVYIRTGRNWVQQAKLLAADGSAGDVFGYSVAISGDTIVVGAWGDASDAGSAYVFVRSGSTWSQQAKLTASDGGAGDHFASSVSVQGDTAVLGAHTDDDRGTDSGSAYVFVRSGTTWTQQAKLVPADGAEGDEFGFSVAVNVNTVAIGAPADDDRGFNSGSAYLFFRTGASWAQQGKVTAADGVGLEKFGFSASLSGDSALFGASDDDPFGASSGSAYVFLRTGTSGAQQAKLTAPAGVPFDYFGDTLAINGNTAVVGAWGDSSPAAATGAAYLYTRSGTAWTYQSKLTATDPAGGDAFGFAVALERGIVVAGASDEDEKGTDAGAAYVSLLTVLDDRPGVYRSSTATWLLDSDGNTALEFPPDRQMPQWGGVPTEVAVTGRWTAGGVARTGFYRDGLWLMDVNNNGAWDGPPIDRQVAFGGATINGIKDVPVVGDWNGDGQDDVGVFRAGYLWVLDLNGNGLADDTPYAFGGLTVNGVGDIPVVGDWNGDGRDDIGIVRGGFLWVLDTNGNYTFNQGVDAVFPLGGIFLNGVLQDVPVIGDWNNDGYSDAGLVRQGFLWLLDSTGDRQWVAGADRSFAMGGLAGDRPVVGKW